MSEEILQLVDNIEQELRRLNVWSELAPSSEAIASTAPFCMDTLHFSQWLQWLFLPRVRAIIESGGVLPTGANIKPYAEEALRVEKLPPDNLLKCMGEFDRLMN